MPSQSRHLSGADFKGKHATAMDRRWGVAGLCMGRRFGRGPGRYKSSLVRPTACWARHRRFPQAFDHNSQTSNLRRIGYYGI
jgi:hypothetical protein